MHCLNQVVCCQVASTDGLKLYLVCGLCLHCFIDSLGTSVIIDEHTKLGDCCITVIYKLYLGVMQIMESSEKNGKTGCHREMV